MQERQSEAVVQERKGYKEGAGQALMKVLYRLRPADAVTLLFLVCLMLVSLVFYQKIPQVKTLILIYSLLLLLQIAFIKTGELLGRNKSAHIMVSVAFPVACVVIIFDSLGLLVHYINPRD